MQRIVTTQLTTTKHQPFRIAVLGDTHLSRGARLDPKVFAIIDQLQPDLLLHTGDLFDSSVIRMLEEIAPVSAVRGNRDLAQWFQLPAIRFVQLDWLRICLFHGHGDFSQYIRMKRQVLNRDTSVFKANFTFPPQAMRSPFIIYGHTHHPRLEISDHQIILNPGALAPNHTGFGYFWRSFALLTMFPDEKLLIEFFDEKAEWHVTCKKWLDKEFFCQGEIT